MSDAHLAPVLIEQVSMEDLGDASEIKLVSSGTGQSGIAERADAVLGLASSALELVEGKNLYKVTVPDGYDLNDLVRSAKDPDSFRALVKNSQGKLNGDVSLKLNGISPTQIASVGLAAAAMIVGQAYMTEISNSLSSIDSKLDTVVSMIEDSQLARVKNAVSIARRYANAHEDYLSRPPEALQAARNEIESRYNDMGEVVDWITDRLSSVEKQAVEAKATEDEVNELLRELRSLEDQFSLCLQALSALAMTRMQYDGRLDEKSALVEKHYIEEKTRDFSAKHVRVAGLIELKIGALKGAPVALPHGETSGNILKRLTAQTPRAAAKTKLLETKKDMQSRLRESSSEAKAKAASCTTSIDRIAAANKASRTLLTDGTDCWIPAQRKNAQQCA